MPKRIFGVKESAANGSPKNYPVAARSPSPSHSSGGYYVYMLECSDNSLYTGYTTNPARRLAEHNRGTAARYTRTRGPVKLVFLQEMADKGEALAREVRIKKLKKNEKLLLCQRYLGRKIQGSR